MLSEEFIHTAKKFMLCIRVRSFCTRFSQDGILARQRTLALIESPPSLSDGRSMIKSFDPDRYLQNHPDAERAVNIRKQMDEISTLIQKMNAREQSGNKLVVFAATAFLTCSVAYTLFQFTDVNTSFTASLPSLFSILDYATARRILCFLARCDSLPVDFGSDDPYMIRMVGESPRYPFTRPLRVCIPIGLGAGIDVDATAPASFLKLGFGSIEVGTVSVSPSLASKENRVEALGYSIAYDKAHRDSSEGIRAVSDRICRYIDSRENDLLSRNCVTCVSISTQSSGDVDAVFSDKRLVETADSIAFDVTGVLTETDIIDIINTIDKKSEEAKSIPVIYLKVALHQSLPPATTVASAIRASSAIVGVCINGSGIASGNSKVTKFSVNEEMRVSGQIVKDRSTEAVREWYKALDCPKTCKEIVASGGVFCGKDALEKIEAGASAVNVFTAFVVDGFPVARRIKTQLSVQLMNKGYYNLEEAIGAKHREVSGRILRASRNRKRF